MRELVSVLGVTAVLGVAGAAMADTVTVDISGYPSNEFQGDPMNHVITLPFTPGDVIHSLEWDLSYTPIAPSWAEEAAISLYDGAAGSGDMVLDSHQWFPGIDDSNPVSGSGLLPLDHTMTTSTLSVELHELNFNDLVGAPDGVYGAGSGGGPNTVTVTYTPIPGPGPLALLGVAALIGGRRRRRD